MKPVTSTTSLHHTSDAPKSTVIPISVAALKPRVLFTRADGTFIKVHRPAFKRTQKVAEPIKSTSKNFFSSNSKNTHSKVPPVSKTNNPSKSTSRKQARQTSEMPAQSNPMLVEN